MTEHENLNIIAKIWSILCVQKIQTIQITVLDFQKKGQSFQMKIK